MYLPEVGGRVTDAHSVYFEIMAEQGFIGLGLFLAIGIFSLQACGSIIRRTRGIADLAWMNDLARMMQVSLIGYAVSGAFLGLAYFNYYYALLAIVVGLTRVLNQEAEVGTLSPDRIASIRPGQMPIRAPTVTRWPTDVGRQPRSLRQPLPGFPTLKEILEIVRRWYNLL
jgi:hypothetical protein